MPLAINAEAVRLEVRAKWRAPKHAGDKSPAQENVAFLTALADGLKPSDWRSLMVAVACDAHVPFTDVPPTEAAYVASVYVPWATEAARATTKLIEARGKDEPKTKVVARLEDADAATELLISSTYYLDAAARGAQHTGRTEDWMAVLVASQAVLHHIDGVEVFPTQMTQAFRTVKRSVASALDAIGDTTELGEAAERVQSALALDTLVSEMPIDHLINGLTGELAALNAGLGASV